MIMGERKRMYGVVFWEKKVMQIDGYLRGMEEVKEF